MSVIKGLKINEADIILPNDKKGKIAVFLYSGESDPSIILDNAIRGYVENNGYNELIDSHLDNPWMRVVVSNINDMEQKQFDTEIHKMKPK